MVLCAARHIYWFILLHVNPILAQIKNTRFESGIFDGTRSGTRTRTAIRPRDFKSLVYTIPPSAHLTFLEARMGVEPIYKLLQSST